MTSKPRQGDPGLLSHGAPGPVEPDGDAPRPTPPACDTSMLQAVVGQAPYPIYVKDTCGRYLFVNAAFDASCNPDGKPIVGRTSGEIYGADRVGEYLAHDRAVLDAGGPLTRNFVHETAERTNTYSSVKFPIRDAAGTAIGVGGIDIDITHHVRRETALRESEARFREMADTVPALIWTSGVDGQCTFVNKRWTEYTGRSVEQELGKGYAESIHPEDRPHSIDQEPILFATREPNSLEYRLRRADGEYRWFLDSFVPRHAPDGSFMGYIGTLVDVTDRRLLEETLSRTQRLEALGRLTGGVAHDFNNLLTVILGNCEMLAEGMAPDSPLQPLVQRALTASHRASELTNRLLAFSRHQTLEPRATAVPELIAQARELLQRTLGEEVDVETKVLSGLWRIVADDGELEHALLNLAINASDAMPRGGRLTFTACNVRLDHKALAAAHLQCPPGDYVALSVVDTGTGMTPEVQRRAVEPFFTTKEVGRGSGLGLSMVYGFCKQSGGDLRIDTAPGRGTTVTLFLPRAEETLAVAPNDPGAAIEPLPSGSETILVVEDNEEVRAYVVGCLSALGYTVLSSRDARAALVLLEQNPAIDLLFTDIVMPGGVSGWELADAARRQRPRLKVLVTSGYAPGYLARPRGTERLPMLAKPYARLALAEKVREVLETPPPPETTAAAA